MTSRLSALLSLLALAALATGCASGRDDDLPDPDSSAQRIFAQAEKAMASGNYPAAIAAYENLTAVYPFSDEARQSQLNLMYVYLRSDQPESVVAAADRFMLENPTHPRVDYALYMKGLARFPREAGPLERLFRIDLDKRPPAGMQQSFNTFQQLLQQHPQSVYAEDARQRMIYLRNRLAAHEGTVAQFYLDRDAYVAAVNRARTVLEAFQETPSVIPALEIMAQAYDKLGLQELAADTRRILEANRAR
jgi:outer membrane protein assembly factor BamD